MSTFLFLGAGGGVRGARKVAKNGAGSDDDGEMDIEISPKKAGGRKGGRGSGAGPSGSRSLRQRFQNNLKIPIL